MFKKHCKHVCKVPSIYVPIWHSKMRVFAVKSRQFAIVRRTGFRYAVILTDFSLCSGPPKHGYMGLGEVLQSSSSGNTSGNK